MPKLKRKSVDQKRIEKREASRQARDGKLVITSSLHQGSNVFSLASRGKQCTPIAYAAIALSVVLSPRQWTTSTITELLYTGDTIYQGAQIERYMDSTELPHVVCFQNHGNIFLSLQDTRSGLLDTDTSNAFDTVEEAIALSINTTAKGALFITCGYTVALIFEPDTIYLFDSHQRNNQGMMSPTGGAVLLVFNCVGSVSRFIRRLYSSPTSQFDCIPIRNKTQHTTLSSSEEWMSNNMERYWADQQRKNEEKQKDSQDVDKAKEDNGDKHKTFANTERKKKQRQVHQFREMEKEKDRIRRATARRHSVYKQKEQLYETAARSKARLDPHYREKEQKNDTRRRSKTRMDPNYRDKEQKYNTSRRVKTRMDPHYREKEQKNDTSRRAKTRLDPNYRDKEQKYNTSRRVKTRMDPHYREKEQKYNTSRRASSRMNPGFREKEQSSDTLRRTKARLNPNYRIRQQQSDTRRHATARTNPLKRKKEQSRDLPRKRHCRLSDTYRKQENERRQKSRTASIMTLSDLISQFHDKVSQGPVYICCSCHQLFYKHSVVNVNSITLPDCEAFNKCVQDKTVICQTCVSHLKKKKYPPCSAANNMAFPDIPTNLLDTKPLEWRLCSPRIVFKKMHEAPRGRQWKIRGNIVNVPTNTTETYNTLPHLASEHLTIKVKLKRMLKYKHHVWSENVRPERVRQVAQYLSGQPLFVEQGITYDPNWEPDAGVFQIFNNSYFSSLAKLL